MATGHLQPGYGDEVVSRFRRARSAGFPLDRESFERVARRKALPPKELDKIRKSGTDLWSFSPLEKTETSYDSHFCSRPADDRMTLRPSSPNRRNRPHPPQEFLVGRLHHIPGYHNADTRLGRGVYRVDASLPVDIREQRMCARQKFVGRQDGAWVGTHKEPTILSEQLGGRSRHGAQAWLKVADEKDHERVYNAIQEDEENERAQVPNRAMRSQTAYPSLTRWMRYAGARESDMFNEVTKSLEVQRDQGFKAPLTTNPFHGRPIISSISSVHSRSDLANLRF